MRIIGGRLRGLALTPVGKGDPRAHLRPTSDRVRENLFNLLGGGRFGDPIGDAHVMDLFAGTGALGLEALSRGASRATFVENGRPALKLLRSNMALCRLGDEGRLLSVDARRIPSCERDPASLVFLDPPYGKGLGEVALEAARAGGWIARGALIVWEDAAERPPPEGFLGLEARRYGDTWLTLLRYGDGD